MGPEQLLKIVVSKNISLVNISRGAYKNCERRKEGDQSDLKMPQNYDPVIIRGCKFVMSMLLRSGSTDCTGVAGFFTLCDSKTV